MTDMGKISEDPTLTADELADGDLLPVVDVSEASDDDKNKNVEIRGLRSALGRKVVETFVDFPSFDGLSDNIHLKVIRDQDKIFGWRYWAAYTGMGSNREHPQVAVSRNGTDWLIPNNCKSPVVTKYSDLTAEIGTTPSVLGDAEIVWDGTTLRVFYIASYTGGNSLMMTESTDGKTWTDSVESFAHTNNANASAASPAVIHEGGANFTMYYMLHDGTAGHYLLTKRTSSDSCATWGAETNCTIPLGTPIPWHVDVVKVGSTYHALILYSYTDLQEPQGNTGTPFYFTSTDGETFGGGGTLDETAVALPWLDREIMQSCYRGCLVPDLDDSSKFDVYMPSFIGYTKDSGEEWSEIVVHRWRDMERLDGTEYGQASPAQSGSNTRNLARRRSVVLDIDSLQDSTTANFAELASRSANAWGEYRFAVPIATGETVHINATIHATCSIADNYRITIRPLHAASSAGHIRVTAEGIGGDTAAPVVHKRNLKAPDETVNCLANMSGAQEVIIKVEGNITYNGVTAMSVVAVRVYPQGDPATFGTVTILKGSRMDVERIGHWEPEADEIVS